MERMILMLIGEMEHLLSAYYRIMTPKENTRIALLEAKQLLSLELSSGGNFVTGKIVKSSHQLLLGGHWVSE